MELGVTGASNFVIELYTLYLCVCVCVCVCPSTGDSELSKQSAYFRGYTSHVQVHLSKNVARYHKIPPENAEGHKYEHIEDNG
jgi:hypothetical protein